MNSDDPELLMEIMEINEKVRNYADLNVIISLCSQHGWIIILAIATNCGNFWIKYCL